MKELKKDFAFKNLFKKIWNFIKKYYNYILFIIVVFLTLYIIHREIKVEDFFSVINNVNVSLLIVALGLMIIYWLLETFMILELIRFEYPEESFRHAFTIMMIGQYYNQVTPSASGGQVVQLMEMSSKGIKPGFGTAVLVQKFALYELPITLISTIGILTNIPTIMSWQPIGKLLLLIGFLVNLFTTIVIILVTFNPVITFKLLSFILEIGLKLHIIKDKDKWLTRINKFISDYSNAADSLKNRKVAALGLFIINTIAILIYFAIAYVIFKALGVNNINIFNILMLQSICYIMMAFVPLPGSAGGAELGFIIVFGALLGSVKSSVALIAWRFITFYFILAVGGIYLAIYTLTANKRKKVTLKSRNEN